MAQLAGHDAQFLIEFTPQRLLRGFARLDMAAEHIPRTGEPGAVGRASAEQDLAVAHQQRANAIVLDVVHVDGDSDRG